ncbi:MAG: hypothetical protein GY762_20830 [Proteobacteria bacterium]|nr:hypothetical protein [Pseudomonadota bacterium]
MNKIKILILLAISGLLGMACGDDATGDDATGDDADGGEPQSDAGGGGGIPAPTDPNYAHINIWDFGRGLDYIDDPAIRAKAYDFYASHIDVTESERDGEGVNELHQRNPNIRVFRYQTDLTACQHVGCHKDRGVVDDPPGAKESFYLHFSEDTEVPVDFVEGGGDTVVITGCSGQITKECRVQTAIWDDYRWVYNQKNPEFRTWMANRFLDLAENWEGIFLDEHRPGFAFSWPDDATGGGIVEFDGKTGAEIEEEFNAELVTTLGVYKETLAAEGKFIVINGADWSTSSTLMMDQIKAVGGTVTEFFHRPNRFDGAYWYRNALDNIDELVAAGALVDLYDAPCREPENSGFTPGNYSSAVARWHMWRLASYYLAREIPDGSVNAGRVYFDPSLCIRFLDLEHVLDFIDAWLPAYEVDVGAPDGPRDAELFASGPSPAACGGAEYGVLSRSYDDGGVLILVRPRDRYDCNVFGDDTVVTVNLPTPMRLLWDDGTLSDPLSSIELRNAEAAILFK